MDATCYVTSRDYVRWFEGKGAIEPKAWEGEERRVGPPDRRRGHDRRFYTERGRRGIRADRRKRG